MPLNPEFRNLGRAARRGGLLLCSAFVGPTQHRGVSATAAARGSWRRKSGSPSADGPHSKALRASNILRAKSRKIRGMTRFRQLGSRRARFLDREGNPNGAGPGK